MVEQGRGQVTQEAGKEQVLRELARIIDPDFGQDIVSCGFVKNLAVDPEAGQVQFALELTTPACPIKDEFEQKARQYVGQLEWVEQVDVTMTAQPQRPLAPDDGRVGGLKDVTHIIAVSSCKGGVGKSTVAVNLAYTLAQMGAKVGIFDADVYGPSLPTMVSPEVRVLIMDPETRTINPTEYEGVKLMSFGFAGQGSAIMRGPMVSGVIQQLLTSANWGKLDYLVVDFPPGTGDIQLTLCQTVQFSAAVIVTTPQKLAFVDVAKGIRMFARMAVPCAAVAENMSFFDGDDGTRYHPFGTGSGDRIKADFGIPHLVHFPILPELSAAGDGGRPLVVSDPASVPAESFMELGAIVVREVAKLQRAQRNAVRYDEDLRAFVVSLPDSGRPEFYLHPAVVRRNDTSAKSINEWTGEKILNDADVADDVAPASVQPLGNYAVQISWQDGLNQVAPFELLAGLPEMDASLAVAASHL
ncbi:P-loop containing nucleoside triphosphate hydrolase protein [Coccomyxa subellipsoidea C-169]|uniref:P-loop containing nucleoside triphosphate hydrolase protein n=1 Tax=Coccomyxa subellipsoidea (strain C-169) TaxID=574566 RepID=I0YY24_COCSC|nr:P-loop containing nucleoside triphosphate hydrolase protein [Coccomyxa subellipsoidea C-169]EIE23293.1 P-loop containing nucleoside triphosphate hydrolase protein [Coccomyxa subellipsoidea C-169]|eukprot:XP_005647837.1 P-loop containing nucleoside triphosphate hydrolase protein [Coccomyxa subellipsoidea C-169]